MKKIILLAVLFFIASTSFSQSFQKEKIYVGPTLGFGWSFGFGASGEYAYNENIGICGDIAYFSFSEGYVGYSWDYSLIGIFVSGAYHFFPKKDFDPYVKLGLGYFNWNASSNGTVIGSAGYSSGIGFGGQIGARYKLEKTTLLRAGIGWPFYLSAGVDFVL